MRVRCERTNRTTRNKSGAEERKGERRQLLQLAVCVSLFLTVFLGKGVFPQEIAQVGPQLLGVIRSNTDFREAFAALGSTVADRERLLDGIGEFCVTVFGIRSEEPASEAPVQVFQPEPMRMEEPEPMPEVPVYRVGDVVETVSVTGKELPENYTYHKLYLGELQTANPVEGTLTSAFGYRDHPTIGRYAVHGGVDIAAAKGTAVLAFGDGTVESVGESDDFGLYLLLEHGNGLTTFYSHCQSIAVRKGEWVHAGQPVAQVGSTGKSTGPHLHFEVRLGEVRLDPMHYITLQGE